ncbi:hypothetical protein, partial [Pseudomonas aeruginosa]|uniref:hypothetical protein n=1 Tax=Pseudomonas aeruginosa TaxID=287 RepID=UPI002E78BD18
LGLVDIIRGEGRSIPAQRYRQWCELAERQRSGLPIEPGAAQWFEVYPKSKEFAAQQRQA